jgi:hypothetical protein
VKRLLFALALTACGAARPPEARTAPAGETASRPQPLVEPRDDAPKLGVEYVAIAVAWVEKYVPAPAAEVRAWAALPESRARVKSAVHDAVVALSASASPAEETAAKKKADALAARIKKGEVFTKVARDASSERVLGAETYAGADTDASSLPAELRRAVATLGSGETTTVRAAGGFHVLFKDAPTEDQMSDAYRTAHAPGVAMKLAEDVLARLRTPDSARAAIASAVEAALGEAALADPDRPQAALAPGDRLASVHLPKALKDGLVTLANGGRAGQALDAPLSDRRFVVVARAVSAK